MAYPRDKGTCKYCGKTIYWIRTAIDDLIEYKMICEIGKFMYRITDFGLMYLNGLEDKS